MIISVNKVPDDDIREATHYWVADPELYRRTIRLQAKAEAAPKVAEAISRLLFFAMQMPLPIVAFISIFNVSLGLWSRSEEEAAMMAMAFGALGLCGVGLAFMFQALLFMPFGRIERQLRHLYAGDKRRRRLLAKAEAACQQSNGMIPISSKLAILRHEPEQYEVILANSKKITSMLVEGRVAETRELLALAGKEVNSELQDQLELKMSAVESDVIAFVKTERDLLKKLGGQEAQNEATVREEGNNMHAKLLLRALD